MDGNKVQFLNLEGSLIPGNGRFSIFFWHIHPYSVLGY